MAPEQVTADRATIGPATDVHALGAILYHALTGVPSFQAGSVVETLD
jgi:serine/threonine-protein kinase